MSTSVIVEAPAKINLSLKVMPRRPDGYHDIKSIFTTVALSDELTVSRTENEGECSVRCEGMLLPKENTITGAYKAFCVLTGVTGGVDVFIKKRIPAGGGLGGGSSDASSFILSLDILFCTHLSEDQFMQISSQVGSDVFFFTKALLEKRKNAGNGGAVAALVEGRGELISIVPPRNDLHILLVFPGVNVSTREAYALVDSTLQEDLSQTDIVSVFESDVSEWSDAFRNDFTRPVCKNYPEVAKALDAIKGAKADFADMSGSGSTVFGIFKDRDAALKARDLLSRDWEVVLV